MLLWGSGPLSSSKCTRLLRHEGIGVRGIEVLERGIVGSLDVVGVAGVAPELGPREDFLYEHHQP